MASNYSRNYNKSNQQLRRKTFFSNEVKKALLLAYYEARSLQTYVNLDFLLYGLLSQSNALSSQLFSLSASQFRNNENLTIDVISKKIQKLNQEKHSSNNLNEFSSEFLNENKKTPWLTSDVKDIIRSAINLAYQTNDKIVVVTTNHLLFALLNKENIRTLLRSIVD